MWSKDDVFEYAMSTFCGKDFNICVIDFIRLCSNLSFAMKKIHGDFRDELVRRFSTNSQDQNRRCKWTVEILYSQIIDDVIDFNQNLKSFPECHGVIFVCLDNEILPYQQALLERSYSYSRLFQFDPTYINYEKLFNCLQGKKFKSVVHNKLVNFYPLLLHVNSISSGLVFNYYFSYLNRQIGSTNSIFVTLTFKSNLNRESFPSTISIKLNTLIENTFLENSPSTIESDYLVPIESKLLVLKFDPTTYRSIDGIQTIVTFSVNGANDFGSIVEQIYIWQDKLDLNTLTSIQLKDDVRQWNQEYQTCSHVNRENSPVNVEFENRDDPRKRCYFFPIIDVPIGNDGHDGVSTMKKTTKDCYESYINDPENSFTKDGQRIAKILIVPVYYIIMPSSCQFGPSDINESTSQCDEIILKGTIIDPDQPNRIQLARSHLDVLRSRPMIHYNRYLRRTFYYVDELDNNNQIIRYLFCGEYPFILSILDHLEKNGQISLIQKHDEYLRFCNMLNRLVQLNNLSESIKLIQFNDEDNQHADFKLLWEQIKEDIDQWYQTLDDDIFSPYIETKIIHLQKNDQIVLFYTDKAKDDQLIATLISDLKEKLEINGYFIEDAKGNLNIIELEKQIIFICTGRKNENINRLIINAIQCKINKSGVLRDVFILINDAIRHFPCRFIRSIPYLTFNLHNRSPYLDSQDIQHMIYYLNNMNVLSKCYSNNFEDINQFLNNSPLQCTSVGEGCAAAFYFNYAKLLISLSDHHYRIELISKQLKKENLIDLNNNKSIFINKWIFVIPSTIKTTNQILPYVLSINENQQQIIGFQLSIWKSTDQNFTNPDLSVTIGGVFQRSYTSLTIYKLTNLITGKSFYFPMEIPAALHGLQNQYENVLSHFNFGSFDPLKQGLAFQKKIQEFLSNDQDKICHEHAMFITIDNSQTSTDIDSNRKFEQAQILLQTLWMKLSSSIQNN